jgi:hypothetical protein
MHAPILLGLISQACLILAQYTLEKEYSGIGFFNGWSFYGNCALSYFPQSFPRVDFLSDDNLTNGDAKFVSPTPHNLHLELTNLEKQLHIRCRERSNPFSIRQ